MPDQLPEVELEDRGSKGRYVLRGPNGAEAEMTFTKIGEHQIIIDHTEVDDEYAGKGLGKKLVKAGVDFARENKMKILPSCPYAKKIFSITPEYGDVLF